MKRIALAAAAALSLAGCAQLDAAVDWINQPKVQTAVATIKTVATALVCDVSSASQLALQVEQAAAQKGAMPITNQVYVASNLVCQRLSGAVVGQVSNVPAVTAVQ
jgi:hypothetical protein